MTAWGINYGVSFIYSAAVQELVKLLVLRVLYA